MWILLSYLEVDGIPRVQGCPPSALHSNRAPPHVAPDRAPRVALCRFDRKFFFP